jgi:hypothetical protein
MTNRKCATIVGMKRRAFLRTTLLSIGFAFSFNVWKPTVQIIQEAPSLSPQRIVRFGKLSGKLSLGPARYSDYVLADRYEEAYGPFVNSTSVLDCV